MGITSTVKIVAATVIFSIAGSMFWYVMNLKSDLAATQANLAISQENQKKLESAVEIQKEVIASQQADIRKQQQINNELNTAQRLIEKDAKILEEKLRQVSLGKIATSKPTSIERAINRGTVNAVRCLELASGAPLNERELNAKTPKELNPECPNLASTLLKPAP